jgi:5'-nucleotidase/UDP-sugar diphosphatase
MQTMPAKSRTAITLGAVLLAVLVGIFVLRSGDRAATPAPVEPSEAITTPEPLDPVAAAPPVETPIFTDDDVADPLAEDPVVPVPVIGDTVPANHVVKAGDTLFDISRMYYGTHVYAGDIERLNGLSNPDRLLVGTSLELPQLASLDGDR